MYFDIVQFSRSDESLKLAKFLGYSNLIFKEDFSKLNVINGGDLNVNNSAVRDKKVDMLLNPHNVRGIDNLHFRNSGLNQTICKLARENNVIIGISLGMLRDYLDYGRVMQNIRLCKKYKVDIAFFSFAKDELELKGVNDMLAFCRILGMDENLAKNSLGKVFK
ncbi:MAG TPA: RNase P subunit p30 family protein [Candidatus Nanoarchaeia archaeon]|nr:RNase P subunit p30 family protein [Candidatus Nanoarchaeia archaeon]